MNYKSLYKLIILLSALFAVGCDKVGRSHALILHKKISCFAVALLVAAVFVDYIRRRGTYCNRDFHYPYYL